MTDGWRRTCSTAVAKGKWIVARVEVKDGTSYEVTHDDFPCTTLARCGSFEQAKVFICEYEAESPKK